MIAARDVTPVETARAKAASTTTAGDRADDGGRTDAGRADVVAAGVADDKGARDEGEGTTCEPGTTDETAAVRVARGVADRTASRLSPATAPWGDATGRCVRSVPEVIAASSAKASSPPTGAAIGQVGRRGPGVGASRWAVAREPSLAGGSLRAWIGRR